MMDITDYQFKGIPVLIYIMIGATTMALTYITVMDDSEPYKPNNESETESSREPQRETETEPEREPERETEREPEDERASSEEKPVSGGGIRKSKKNNRHKASKYSRFKKHKTK